MNYKILNEKQYKKVEKLYNNYLDKILKKENTSRKKRKAIRDAQDIDEDVPDELEIYCLTEPMMDKYDPRDFKGVKKDEDGEVYNYMAFIPYNILCQLSIEQIQELIKVSGR